MNNDTYHKWLAQLRKGYLELCVLVILQQKRTSYGFELLQVFQHAGLAINEGTLYPLLNRMHKQGWLNSRWETPADSGHPRRFYELSDAGKAQLPQMLATHREQQQSLDRLLELA